MSEDYKAILQRVFDEVLGQGRVDLADEIIAPGAVDHEMPGVTGPDSLKQGAAMLRTAFSDLKFSMDDAIVEGDRIAARFTMTGTHSGEFQGVPATGKSVKVSGVDIVRFEGGKAVEHWGYMDQIGLMQQIGAIPAE